MRLRTFTAASVPEAMKLVRAALGPDAVIVSQRQARPGGPVEVRAAVEQEPEPEAAPAPVTALEIEQRLQATLIERLRGRSPAEAQPPAQPAWSPDQVGAVLAQHRIPHDLAERLDALSRAAGIADVALALAAALDKCVRFDPVPPVPEARTIVVGPAGAGKTTVVARLAARAALAGRTTRVVTADTLRAGGMEQLGAFVRLLGLSLESAAGPDALAERLAGASDPVLIDSTGCNPYALNDVQDLRALIAASGAEPVLVLPAGIDAAEAADVASVFAGLGCRRMIATRLDATRRLGGIVAAAASGLSLAHAANTPYVAHGLVPMSALALARFMTDDAAFANPTELRHAAQ